MTRFRVTIFPTAVTLVLASGCSNGAGGVGGVSGGRAVSTSGGTGAGGQTTASSGGGTGSGGQSTVGSGGSGGTGSGGQAAITGGAGIGTGGAGTGGVETGTGGLESGGAGTGGSGPAGISNGGGIASSGGAATTGGSAGGTGIAATPAMGWNNFHHFINNFTHTTFEQAADAMVSSGLKAVGYQYINIDDSWATSRGADGNLVVDTQKFPGGIKALADYVHTKGLKLGIYTGRGTMTCAKFPGSYGYEAKDIALFASWGIDFVKVDNCYPNVGTSTSTDRTQMGGTVDGTVPNQRYQTAQQADFTAWANGIKAAGRPMLFSICAWWFYTWEPTLGNMFRTTKDIKSNWTSFLATLDGNGGDTTRYTDANFPAPGIAQYAGPGHFNDPDMLEVGNTVAGGGMTIVEQQSQFSLWAIMAAPLILGNDLTNMSAQTLGIIANAEVIAVDQDPLGKQGTPISTSITLEVWSKPLAASKSYAVALFNRTAAAANITVTWSSLGLTGAATVRDLWAKQDLGSMAAQYTVNVASHAVVILKIVGQ
jgi:alpha-galactosidase